MTLPIKHLSARVPWHDNKWNGNFCCNVLDNSFCRILPRIDDSKNPETERRFENQQINDANMPPCIAEKGTFLSPHEYTRVLEHSWKSINPLYKEYLPGKYLHKPYSFNAVPFLWMIKLKAKDDHVNEKASVYGLDYKPDLEEEIDQKLGFEGNTWVQHPENQRIMLDSFFGCLKEKESLVFFYAKHSPLSETNERIIVGVAKVQKIGSIQHYEFPSGYAGYRGYPWDRCIEHTLRADGSGGVLLPYHELIEKSKTEELDLHEFAALAPDYAQFSYASELVEHDVAIDALWRIAESLRKAECVLGITYKKEFDWIDNEISRIWDMRGAFPGIGSVLSAIKISQGNAIAWELEKHIRSIDADMLNTNPWSVFEESISNPQAILGLRGSELFTPTMIHIWKSIPAKKKQFYILLSRIQLDNEQAQIIINNYKELIGTVEDILSNPFLIYERLRIKFHGVFSFTQIDNAVLPPIKIRNAFPLEAETKFIDFLDERRVRALAVLVLEEGADEGHSILPFKDVLDRMAAKKLSEECPINDDILLAQAEDHLFQNEVTLIQQGSVCFLKLQRLQEMKSIIVQRINPDIVNRKTYNIEKDWRGIVDEHIRGKNQKLGIEDNPETFDEFEILARQEKAEALRVLCNYHVSVLIGPAGSGKTTLLEIFEKLPEIKNGGLIKLAPTGKARVKMGLGAKTVAQYLYHSKRYDSHYGVYYPLKDGAKDPFRNIIIDESSMLTEEQLGAILDALGPMDRIILVGDYRQLPPIGTGRPFVDIVQLLKPKIFADPEVRTGPGYAELRQIRRQKKCTSSERKDIVLSRCFGDEPRKEDLAIIQGLSEGTEFDDHIRLIKWYDSKNFQELFEKTIQEELELDPKDLIKSFNRTIGAKDIGAYQYFNYDFSEYQIENWQIVSPTNGYGYGVKEINKLIQTTFRKSFIDLAHNLKDPQSPYFQKRKIAKPKGTDNIVYGDKVISLKNTSWRDNQWIRPFEKKSVALNYFANGEIGIITGEFRGKGSDEKGEPRVEITFSTQPGYSYSFNAKDLTDDENKYQFELAYAITVHKSQGSGFKKVFLVLPSSCPVLCRELLYTAFTRQEDKIIILHQGEFRDFIRFASTDASATARRFTDLFFLPDIKQINNKYYDSKHINVSERGELMISKSEVIIANCLNKYKNEIRYAYEDKLTLQSSGRTIKPDFTIEHLGTGRVFYWEHLGMMTLLDYRKKWEKKKQGYLDNGFVLFTNAIPDNDKVLIITEDNPNGGIDSQHFDEIIRKYILGNQDH
jgi:ATP-dependent exoDNAse (exonuclease V) alpha subunit